MTPAVASITGGSDRAYHPFIFYGTSYVDQKKDLEDQFGQADTEVDISFIVPQSYTAPISAKAISAKRISKGETVVPLTKEVEKPSPAYAELILNNNLNNMLASLVNLKSNLGNAQGAQDMSYFRDNIKNIWVVKDSLPHSIVLIICALEEAIKDRRWRDLTLGQVGVLEVIVQNLLNKKASLESVLHSIHKSGIDIYPSVENDTDESNGEE